MLLPVTPVHIAGMWYVCPKVNMFTYSICCVLILYVATDPGILSCLLLYLQLCLYALTFLVYLCPFHCF